MAERAFLLAVWAAAIGTAACLLWMLTDLLLLGLPGLSWSFVIAPTADAGRAGGIGPILASTVLVLAVALTVAVPVGLGVALWLAEFAPPRSRTGGGVSMALDVLAGVPSIVYGLFGNALFCVALGMGFSILSGGLTLACMILPILVRSCEAGLSALSDDWRRGAAALGMSRTTLAVQILLPAAAPAIAAGLVLGIGRALAESAALLYTSGYVDRMPASLSDSGRVLAVHIYDLSMNVTGGDRAAYASALVLIGLVALFNMLALGLSDRWLARRIAP